MRAGARAFTVPEGAGAAELAALLAPLGVLAPGPPRRSRPLLLDTFDWRARRAGLLLEQTGEGRATRTVARTAGDGRIAAAAPGPAPRFARALPPGPLRELLRPLLEPRAILPQVVLEREETPLLLHARSGAVVARLALERRSASLPGADGPRSLPTLLRLRGGRDSRAVAALLAARPGFPAASGDEAAAALAAFGLAPGDPGGKPRVDLDPEMPARDALRLVLLELLGAMERNLPGLRENLDPEFLHDFRVAVRRSRSVLGQVKGVLPAATAARFAAQLRGLQEATGPARDLDVFLQELPGLRGLLPARSRRSLGPLARILERRRAEAQRALLLVLDAPRFARFRAAWRAFLERPSPRRPRGAPKAQRPIRRVAAARIRARYRRAVAEGRAIGPGSPAGQLHELRKSCKKLRYLLEVFRSLFDQEEVRAAVETLKGLQDDLGRHQDLQVQADALLGLARDLAAEGRARPSAYLAMGMLVEALREGQGRARREFAERFRPFAARENRRRMRRLLRGPAPEGAG